MANTVAPRPPARYPHKIRHTFDDATLNRLEEFALLEGVSRSEALRILIERGAGAARGEVAGPAVRRLA
jgi:hypothetical protein